MGLPFEGSKAPASAWAGWYPAPLGALLGEAPSEDTAPSVMFSLADRATLSDHLTGAGLHAIALTPLSQPPWFGDDLATAVEAFMGSGPVQAVLQRRPTLTDDDARAILHGALRPYLTDGGVRLPGAYWLIEASTEP